MESAADRERNFSLYFMGAEDSERQLISYSLAPRIK